MLQSAILACLLFPARPAAARARPRVLPGIDVLLSERLDLIRGKRVALVTHAAAVTSDLEPTIDALFHAPGVKLVALMGPEHGLRGAAYAGETVADRRDPKTGLPVYSLFGAHPKPTPAMLKGVDVVVIDFQDLGVRSYTYKYTMLLTMEAAAEADIPVIVLDRPDPLGGTRVEGNLPPAGWTRTNVCSLPVPYVFGMTSGELARMINGEGWLAGGKKCRLTVVPVKGWHRGMLWPQTGLPWVPPSPHIPHWDSSLFYAATGLFGPMAAGYNNGVGYTLPFQLIGTPWADGDRLAEKLNARGLPGVHFRPLDYRPFYLGQKGVMCGGVQVHLTDPAAAPLFPINFYAFQALHELYPARDLYGEPERPRGLWDRLSGKAPASVWTDWENAMCDPSVRRRLAEGVSADAIVAGWRDGVERFEKIRRKYLLYR
jgi:uncharacterized protein YbbC (DUF1343 family)